MQYRFSDRFFGNLAQHVGDNALHVSQNREQLASEMGVKTVIFMDQVHEDAVACIEDIPSLPPCADAMISRLKEVALAVMVADCVPIVLYDAPTQSMGVVHAGRKGSALHVSLKTVLMMQERYGVKAHTLKAYIGPHIGPCCYEVGKEALVGLEHVSHEKEGRYFLDLREANRLDLLNAGLQASHIEVTSTCTCCDRNYFSYRREGITGRFVGVIRL